MSTKPEKEVRRPPSRWTVLLVGVALGFAWGTLMWALTTAFGQDTGGARGWLYIAITMAMIGGGISAVFGARGVRQRGERVAPRFRRRR